MNEEVFGESKLNETPIADSSGDRLLSGIGAWLTYRNWAFKPGIHILIYNNLNVNDLDYRVVAGVESLIRITEEWLKKKRINRRDANYGRNGFRISSHFP